MKVFEKKSLISIRKLTVLAEIEHSQISRIEKGLISPSAVTIQKIADAMKVTPCDFFDC